MMMMMTNGGVTTYFLSNITNSQILSSKAPWMKSIQILNTDFIPNDIND